MNVKITRKVIKPNISFGVDEPTKYSTYHCNFNVRSHMPDKVTRPKAPKGAQLLPTLDPAFEKSKYLSTTKTDFSESGKGPRKMVYESCKGGYNHTRNAQTCKHGLLTDDSTMPFLTNYDVEFRTDNTLIPGTPTSIKFSKNVLLEHRDKGDPRLCSEAHYRYQWPETSNIQKLLPRHVIHRFEKKPWDL